MGIVKSCDECNAECCRYVAIEIDCPEDLDDFENIKWYVAHENIKVFVDMDDAWVIEFSTPCKYLVDNKCSIHEKFTKNPGVKRPKICKEFSVEECPFHNEYEEKYEFNLIEDVEKYVKEVFLKGKHVVV